MISEQRYQRQEKLLTIQRILEEVKSKNLPATLLFIGF